jgi:hypothetical protein
MRVGDKYQLVAPWGGKSSELDYLALLEQCAWLAGSYGEYGYGNPEVGASVTVNVHTDLMKDPIPVYYVPEGSGLAEFMMNAPILGDPGGITLNFLGGAYIRYQRYTSSELPIATMHECLHYYEQSKWGPLWYYVYKEEFLWALVFHGFNFWSAHDAVPAEVRAITYAAWDNTIMRNYPRILEWHRAKQILNVMP